MKKSNNKNPLDRGDGKDYELQILKYFREKHPKKLVLDDQRQMGIHSKTPRQIDVGLYTNTSKPKLTCVIECKNLGRKVSLERINAFYGFLDDVDVKNGIMVTTQGFTKTVKTYAESKKIKLQRLTYEYLKDYYYISPNRVGEMWGQCTNYTTTYCKNCNLTSLYEIGEVFGAAEWEPLACPKCKTILVESVRSDANHRIVKNFLGENVSEKELNDVKVKHINATRSEWDFFKSWWYEAEQLQHGPSCAICHNEFNSFPPTRMKMEYKGIDICWQCMNSSRWLLIDNGYL